MPRLTENVLIGDRVRLAGEDILEVDAKSVRPEVFTAEEPSAGEPVKPSARRKRTTDK